MAVPSGYVRGLVSECNPVSVSGSTGALLVELGATTLATVPIAPAGMTVLSTATVTANNSGNTANASATPLSGNVSGKVAIITANATAYLGLGGSINNDGSNAVYLAANTPLTLPISNVAQLSAFGIAHLANLSVVVLG